MPAPPTMETVVVGQFITAAFWNGQVRDLGLYATQRAGVRVRRAADQSVNSGTLTAISWDTEDADTDAYITVPSTTITIPAGLGGLYAVTFAAQFPTGTLSGRCFIEIAPTSALTHAQYRLPFSPVGESDATIAVTIPLTVGDTFECRVFHGAGAARDFTAWMSCALVGP